MIYSNALQFSPVCHQAQEIQKFLMRTAQEHDGILEPVSETNSSWICITPYIFFKIIISKTIILIIYLVFQDKYFMVILCSYFSS
jgi:hypothetical protein